MPDVATAEAGFAVAAAARGGWSPAVRPRGLNVNGTCFAFLNHEQLVLKLPEATTAALIDAGDATVAANLSPTMRKWVSVPLAHAAADRGWRQLIVEARAHAIENQRNHEPATASVTSAPRQGRPRRRSDAHPGR